MPPTQRLRLDGGRGLRPRRDGHDALRPEAAERRRQLQASLSGSAARAIPRARARAAAAPRVHRRSTRRRAPRRRRPDGPHARPPDAALPPERRGGSTPRRLPEDSLRRAFARSHALRDTLRHGRRRRCRTREAARDARSDERILPLEERGDKPPSRALRPRGPVPERFFRRLARVGLACLGLERRARNLARATRRVLPRAAGLRAARRRGRRLATRTRFL